MQEVSTRGINALRANLSWIGFAGPLLLLLVLEVARLIHHDPDFGLVALTAAGGYIILAAPLLGWLDARGIGRTGLRPYGYLLLAGFGIGLAVEGLQLVRGTPAHLVHGFGTLCLVGLAIAGFRRRKPNGS